MPEELIFYTSAKIYGLLQNILLAVQMPLMPTPPGNTEPLASLPPLALPEAIDWWPPAPGWWLVTGVALIAMVILIMSCLQYWRAGSIKRACINKLGNIYQGYQTPSNIPNQLYTSTTNTNREYHYLHEANQLIRQFCLQHYNCRSLTTKSGEAWLAELDTLTGKPCLNSNIGRQLLKIYNIDNVSNINIEELQQTLMQWFRNAPVHFKLRIKFR